MPHKKFYDYTASEKSTKPIFAKQEDSWPDGHYDMKPSWIIKIFIRTQYDIYVYIYLVAAGSF